MHGCEVHFERTVSATKDSCPLLQDTGGRAQRWLRVFAYSTRGGVRLGSPVSRPDLPRQWQQQEGVKTGDGFVCLQVLALCYAVA
jgi:hypothetical protein